jgi:hypothetical protein
MSCPDKPAVWNWNQITQGDTRLASNVTETASTTDLSRVLVTIEKQGTDIVSLTLDSDATGITINTATAGAWDYDIDIISAATMETLDPGFYTVTHQVFDALGVKTTVSKGHWNILEK